MHHRVVFQPSSHTTDWLSDCPVALPGSFQTIQSHYRIAFRLESIWSWCDVNLTWNLELNLLERNFKKHVLLYDRGGTGTFWIQRLMTLLSTGCMRGDWRRDSKVCLYSTCGETFDVWKSLSFSHWWIASSRAADIIQELWRRNVNMRKKRLFSSSTTSSLHGQH